MFKVKGSGHNIWKFLLPRGAYLSIDTLKDGEIVTVDEERGVFVHIAGRGWTKREWLVAVEEEPPLPPPVNLFERIDRLEAWARTQGFKG